MYSMVDGANLFEDFKEPLSTFFQLSLDTQSGIIKLFNASGPHLSIHEFASAAGIDAGEAEYVLQTLAILVKERDDDPEKFASMLDESKMPQSIKSIIGNFTTKLNTAGKNGFKMRYFIDADRIDEPALTSIRHTVFLKAVEDHDRAIVCHTPVIRLEFLFDNKRRTPKHAYMSIEQLQIMIDDLRDIYQNSAKIVKAYKTARRPDLLVVGNEGWVR